MKYRLRTALCAVAITSAGALLTVAPAYATTASETLTAGSLGFVSAPGNVTFPGTTLDGTNRTVTVAQAFDVGDATGSGSGWNVTATSTTFTAGAKTLATNTTTIASAPSTPTCDASVTCTAGGSTTVSYPYTLPAATTAPTATKMYNAPANTGMGDQTVTPTWTLTIPANAFAGSYSSTWTVSLVSGP